MKLLMIICPEERQAEIRELIRWPGAHACTELTNVIGEGIRVFALPVESLI